MYIEDLVNPNTRSVKFWFAAQLIGGNLDVLHPEARLEHILEAAWLNPAELQGKQMFPSVIGSRYASDKESGSSTVVCLPMRRMEFW